MNTQMYKSIILAIIVGLFATGCYTQLKSVEKEQQDYQNSTNSTIVNYQPVYTYYPGAYYYDLYNPYYGYGIGYGYGLGFGYGINNFNHVVTDPSGTERKKQIRSSGLYSSGEQPNRRTRADASYDSERNRSSEASDTHRGEGVQRSERNERTALSKNESTAISKRATDNILQAGNIKRRSIPTETRPYRMLAYSRVNIEKRVQTLPIMEHRKWDRGFSFDHNANRSSMIRRGMPTENIGHSTRGMRTRSSNISASRSVSGTSIYRSPINTSNNVRHRSTSNSSTQNRSSGSSSKNNRNR